jgi:C1A family cysteine protease
MSRKYNHISKPPSHTFSLLKGTTVPLPSSVDLRSKCPPIYDQGQLGSCTANALAFLMSFDDLSLTPSRLFIYYNERVIENSIPTDSGASLSDGIQTLLTNGVCPEIKWPYIISQFAVKPTPPCYIDALQHKALQVFQVQQNITSMKSCLAQGLPFCCGIQVFSSFESQQVTRTGVVPLPSSRDQLLGGHAVACVGYNDVSQQFIMRNSWGTKWGQSGYFKLPYSYLLNPSLASDMWAISKVNIPVIPKKP